MSDSNSRPEPGSTKNSKFIRASPEDLYLAFIDPDALAVFLAPGEMTGKVHHFNLSVGGGYQMSLFYPGSDKDVRGKTSDKEDRFTARFVELSPPKKIVEAIRFDSGDPAFSGEMIMEISFEPRDLGTEVIVIFRNIPPGIKPEDNEKGTELTLQKLAAYVE